MTEDKLIKLVFWPFYFYAWGSTAWIRKSGLLTMIICGLCWWYMLSLQGKKAVDAFGYDWVEPFYTIAMLIQAWPVLQGFILFFWCLGVGFMTAAAASFKE